LKLKMITNRGVKVYPDGLPETFCTDHWRCRFTNKDNSKDVHAMKEIAKDSIPNLMTAFLEEGIDVVKTENLYYFNNELAFSLGQGE
jgi:isocitrate dehydrogenase